MRKSTLRTIKNTVLGMALVVLFIGALGYVGNCDFCDEKGYIEKNGTYYETGSDKYIITEDGHIWDVYVSQFENGDEVRVTFDFNGTPEVEDDEVVEVKGRWF